MAVQGSTPLLRLYRHRLGFLGVPQLLHGTWRTCSPRGLLSCRSLHVEGPPHVPSVTSSCVHGTSSTSLVYSTIGQCLQAAAHRWPDREAVVFPQEGVRKTFAQFQEDVDKTAAGLLALGLNRGDRLGVWGPNTYEWILYQYATAKAGIIMVWRVLPYGSGAKWTGRTI
ncbi:unnamed protein product [Boreogadus saida]